MATWLVIVDDRKMREGIVWVLVGQAVVVTMSGCRGLCPKAGSERRSSAYRSRLGDTPSGPMASPL